MADKEKKGMTTSESSHEKHVEAGHKGAEARWAGHEKKAEETATSGSSHEKHVEAGHKGSEARWGK